MAAVLVVDDEESNRLALERIFAREGLDVRLAAEGRAALATLRENDIGVVVSDLKMPGLGGMELLRAARQVAPHVQVILVTAYGTVETAVEAMKEGAYDFVTKPLRREAVVASVRKALQAHDLLRENQRLRDQIAQAAPGELIGQSAPMRALMEEARQVAPAVATVMITGESGTGKGLLARWIHDMSARRDRRIVTVNCGAIPEALLESELFGYEAGAFTGAQQRKEGRFDLAAGGTLFLDEVTEMPTSVQVKLLRALHEGEYERLGGTRTLRADVRVIAATNRDPRRAVDEGRLRSDLFYRLNVVALHAPPLRDRREDIALLARHFAAVHARRNTKGVRAIEPEALAALERWDWPGNVRELENAVERAVVLARDEVLRLGDLPPAIGRAPSGAGEGGWLTFPVGTPIDAMERRMIEATLRKCEGDRTLAANLLGISVRSIYRREAEWRGGDDGVRRSERVEGDGVG
jgi:two-component system response regulator HydG